MASRGVLAEELLQLPVEPRGIEGRQRRVQSILVVLGQQHAQGVGDAGAHPHSDRLPPQLFDRLQSAEATDQDAIRGDRDWLQQADALDRAHQGSQVTFGIGAVSCADFDRVDSTFKLDVAVASQVGGRIGWSRGAPGYVEVDPWTFG